jgi:hypothetical protein
MISSKNKASKLLIEKNKSFITNKKIMKINLCSFEKANFYDKEICWTIRQNYLSMYRSMCKILTNQKSKLKKSVKHYLFN